MISEIGRARLDLGRGREAEPWDDGEGLDDARKRRKRFAFSRDPASFPSNRTRSLWYALVAVDAAGELSEVLQVEPRRAERKRRGRTKWKASGEDDREYWSIGSSLASETAGECDPGRGG